MRTLFIVNPAAGHGRAGGRWEKARALAKNLYPDMELVRTEKPGHGRELAREAVSDGVDLVVAVGGDGTLGEVVDGYLAVPEAARRGTTLSTYPAGSGCDFSGHMGVPREPEAWAEFLAAGTRRRLDAGRATFRAADGAPRSRHFLNVAALGLPGEVALAVDRHGKFLGGTMTYLVEGVLAVLAAKARPMRLTVDGATEPEARYHLVAAANTSTFGGGMRLAPGADAEDGLLDLLTIADMTRPELLSLLPRAYAGAHAGRPGVVLRRARRIEIHSEESLPLNIDGDADGLAPVVFEALPKAIAFRL
ncbi:MAG: diacylglycerol kinase family lipid kinase [Elusimicrobiota bacterium]|nr:diacylglycerol kinase family lipid kinase [Elusimicrobiota bacterium]